jgi:hypothetical protein
MGYAEFGGGGSVKWKVEHGGSDTSKRGITVNKGDDPKPTKEQGGQFLVLIKAGANETLSDARTTIEPDGTVRVTFDIDHKNPKQIRIFWTP